MIEKPILSYAVLLGTFILAVTGCSVLNGPKAEARYRMTVEVETPQGTVSGSSVWSQHITKLLIPLPSGGGSQRYGGGSHGEAVAVRLPNGQTLFLLQGEQRVGVQAYFPEISITDPDGGEDPVATLGSIGSSGITKTLPCTPEALEAWNVSTKQEYKLTKASSKLYCPPLVALKDAKDPTSFASVNPDDLASSFGAGHRLKSITLEVTKDPVTNSLGKLLNEEFWTELVRFKEKTDHCRNLDHPYFRQLATTINKSDFTEIDYKNKSKDLPQERDTRIAKYRAISCEDLVPGYESKKLRKLAENPVFSYKPLEAPVKPQDVGVARWKPRFLVNEGGWQGRLVIRDGCLAFEDGRHPAKLLVFPYGHGFWNSSTQTLEHEGESYSINEPIYLRGDFAKVFVDGGKVEFQEDADWLGRHDFQKCNGFDMLLVYTLAEDDR
jgi:hypothetical protein